MYSQKRVMEFFHYIDQLMTCGGSKIMIRIDLIDLFRVSLVNSFL